MRPPLTLTVESVETWSAGVAVVSGETRFTDAGPSSGIWPAGVVHSAGCAALAVCREMETGLLAVNKVISDNSC